MFSFKVCLPFICKTVKRNSSVVEIHIDLANRKNELSNLFLWASKWNFKFKLKKWNLIRFSGDTSPISFSYEVGRVSLPMVTHHPYLGLVELSSDLSWDLHIAALTKKANQILAFLSRNLGNCPVKVKEQVYFTLV